MNFPGLSYICKYCKRTFDEPSRFFKHKEQCEESELLRNRQLRYDGSNNRRVEQQQRQVNKERVAPQLMFIEKSAQADPKGHLSALKFSSLDIEERDRAVEKVEEDYETGFSSASTIGSSDSSSRETSFIEELNDNPAVQATLDINRSNSSVVTQVIQQSVQPKANYTSVIVKPPNCLTAAPTIKNCPSGDPAQKKKFNCIHCPKKFSTKWNCKVHMATHTAKMPQKCQFCPQLFQKLVEKVAHELTHRDTVKQVQMTSPKVDNPKFGLAGGSIFGGADISKREVTDVTKLAFMKLSNPAVSEASKITETAKPNIPEPKPKASVLPKPNVTEMSKPSGNGSSIANNPVTTKLNAISTFSTPMANIPVTMKLSASATPKVIVPVTPKSNLSTSVKGSIPATPKPSNVDTLKVSDVATSKANNTELPKSTVPEPSSLAKSNATTTPKAISSPTSNQIDLEKCNPNATPVLKPIDTVAKVPNASAVAVTIANETSKANGIDKAKVVTHGTPRVKSVEVPISKIMGMSKLPLVKLTDILKGKGADAIKPKISNLPKPDQSSLLPVVVGSPRRNSEATQTVAVVAEVPQVQEKRVQKAIVKPITDANGRSKPKKRRKKLFSSLSFKCKQCFRGYSSKYALQIHLKRVHVMGQSGLQCSYCNKGFFTAQERVAHEKLHSKRTCHYCKKRFLTSSDLVSHVKSTHPQSSENLANNGESNANDVLSYLTSEDMEERREDAVLRKGSPKGFQCAFCKKVFRLKLTLKVHERIHTGVRPYKCNLCHMTFTQSHVLTEHFRTHTGEKPYCCPYCGKKFSHKSSYNVHTKVHQRNGDRRLNKFNPDHSAQDDNSNMEIDEMNPQTSFHYTPMALAEGISQTLNSGLLLYVCDSCKITFDYRVDANKHSKIHAQEVV